MARVLLFICSRVLPLVSSGTNLIVGQLRDESYCLFALARGCKSVLALCSGSSSLQRCICGKSTVFVRLGLSREQRLAYWPADTEVARVVASAVMDNSKIAVVDRLHLPQGERGVLTNM